MAEWQPMETAPRDTAILVYNCAYHVAHFNTAYGKWVGFGDDTPDTRDLNGLFPPTHWMPLPDPPAGARDEA